MAEKRADIDRCVAELRAILAENYPPGASTNSVVVSKITTLKP